MKLTKTVLMFAAATVMVVSAAFAQQGDSSGSFDTASYDFGSYYAQTEGDASPSDAPVAVEGAVAGCGCDASPSCGCQSCCRERNECCPLECEDCEPWRLFPCGFGPCNRVSVNGWIAGGATAADHNPTFTGPVSFNDRTDFQLNQAYLVMERAVDAECGCWDWGGRVDLLYGTDHRFTMARGLETRGDFSDKWNSGGSNTYGLALPQAYLEVSNGDLSIKVGHYYTIIGYESVMAPSNFFYSHAYTMQYGEPFTHTGFLASYAISPCLTAYLGLDQGWDNWEDDNSNPSGLWGLGWDGGCGTTVTLAGTLGKEFSANGVNTQRSLTSLVATHEFNSRWTYVFQSDIGHQNNDGTGTAEWYGINQYLFYKINCCWSAGLRFEWFRDDDGARVTGVGDNNAITGSSFAGNFSEVSLGLNWKPNSNLVVRPELRYDEYSGLSSAAAGARPFDDGTDSNQFSAAVDAIFLW